MDGQHIRPYVLMSTKRMGEVNTFTLNIIQTIVFGSEIVKSCVPVRGVYPWFHESL